VPPGHLITYGFAGTLRDDDDTYPDPGDYDVGRWIASNHEDPPPQAEKISGHAFGGGPRMCPGRRLAGMEARMLLQRVLSDDQFQWELTPGQNLEQRYTPGFFPVDGCRVKLLN